MKDDSMTPSDSTIPPQSSPPPQPVAPKDSLSVEVEDLKTRFLGDEHNSIGDIFDCIKRLFEIVDELRKERDDLKRELSESLPHKYDELHLMQGKLYLAQAEIRRKDEALEKITRPFLARDDAEHEIRVKEDIARAALADGKEGEKLYGK